MMKRLLTLLCCCLSLGAAMQSWAQKLSESDLEVFRKGEEELLLTADSMYRAYMHDDRIAYCHKFVKQLSTLLKREQSFSYPFDKLSKKIHIMYPDDQQFRIFNWSIEYKIAGFRYYGAVQRQSGQLIPLLDMSEQIEGNALYGPLSNRNWFGCEYYRILTQKSADGSPLYFVFGVNNNADGYSVKTVDLLSFSAQGLTFGGNHFTVEGRPSQRFVLEFQKGAQVSLNWDKDKNMIVYDHLMSEVNQPQRRHTMVPSGSMDGLKWQNFQWMPVADVVPIMKLRDGQAPVNGVIPGQ